MPGQHTRNKRLEPASADYVRRSNVPTGRRKGGIPGRAYPAPAAFDKKELPPLEPGAMCYMTSKQQYLNDDGVH